MCTAGERQTCLGSGSVNDVTPHVFQKGKEEPAAFKVSEYLEHVQGKIFSFSFSYPTCLTSPECHEYKWSSIELYHKQTDKGLPQSHRDPEFSSGSVIFSPVCRLQLVQAFDYSEQGHTVLETLYSLPVTEGRISCWLCGLYSVDSSHFPSPYWNSHLSFCLQFLVKGITVSDITLESFYTIFFPFANYMPVLKYFLSPTFLYHHLLLH